MPCCGGRRAALRTGGIRERVLPVVRDVPLPATEPLTTLRYLGRNPLILRGPVTGAVYRIGGEGATTLVRPADVAAFRATGLFI